ncbi:hypothetical protein B0T24DRAFT_635967 [Lasiosphaeria ovina]|uniref:Uncharacterized protein n=1 Tax=Lasiosphaeria ovina TaxID=92902 RepID=A0AAE0JXE7_9PEZI|nr:hypothetical protein B0T24DRAFT_635967 [Lasiosphaeria ovina]
MLATYQQATIADHVISVRLFLIFIMATAASPGSTDFTPHSLSVSSLHMSLSKVFPRAFQKAMDQLHVNYYLLG